ncbi:Rap1 - C-terminal [Penicillium canescens]|nr:Rap1 - C-terminal [Penicillium canescens]
MASSGNGGTGDSLFKGAKFWLSQTVPQRLRFKEMIAKHGGTVVLMEKDADVKLVDHAKKGIPPDTYSYRYVERSILNGRLEDLEAHRAGTSRPRPTGATHIATKGTRQPFTLKDDQILFDWIAHIEKKEPGAPLSGNKVYIELEQLCPRHSWQSWRTRYVRQLRGKPRPGGGVPQSHPEFMQAAPSSSKRKRDSGPKPVDKAQAADSSSKGEQLILLLALLSPDLVCRPLVPSPFANTRRGNLAFPPPPFNTTQQPIPVSRPRGDNAFAQSGRFKKQPNKDRPQVDDPFKDPVDAVFLELPFFPSSPTPDVMDDDTSDGPDVDTWIDERLSWGIDENHVFDALRCTSMVPDMADKVLKHLAAGNGIPEGIPGVWTADDDRCLQAEERANVERALTKHGAEFVKERWEYYRMAREAGLI